MSHGSGVSRGDRNRNARLARLRALVPVENAIVGIDLADAKQMVVVCDHDSKVLARKTFRCRAWDLGVALDWAAGRAAANGLAGVTVACEPTGHRWRVLGQLAADRGMPFVCVQPALSSWSRRAEDLTFDKTDEVRREAPCRIPNTVRRNSEDSSWVQWLTRSRKVMGTRACHEFGGHVQMPGVTRRGTCVIWRKLDCLNRNLQ
ncbi:MAG: IS110 family transposase [Pseudonocardiaceae bacterium]